MQVCVCENFAARTVCQHNLFFRDFDKTLGNSCAVVILVSQVKNQICYFKSDRAFLDLDKNMSFLIICFSGFGSIFARTYLLYWHFNHL